MDEVLKPLLKVWAATIGAITFTLANVQIVFSIILLALSICYTGWQWYRAKKKADREDKKNETNH